MKMKPPSGPKNKPKTKPILSAVEWANFRKTKMKLKSLAGKSGHTQTQANRGYFSCFLAVRGVWFGHI
jgi:hypothetical protein